MFEGIDDSSDDDESLNSAEGTGEGEDVVVGRIEVEGVEVGRQEEGAKTERKEKGEEGGESIVV